MTLSEFINKIENIVKENIDFKEDKFTIEEKFLKLKENLNEGELKDRINIKPVPFALYDKFYFTVDNVPIVELDYFYKTNTYTINQVDEIEGLYNNKSVIPNLRLNTVIYDIKEHNRNKAIERIREDIKEKEDEIKDLKSKIMLLADEREEDLSKYIYSKDFVNYESNADPDFDPLYDENNLPFPLDDEVER